MTRATVALALAAAALIAQESKAQQPRACDSDAGGPLNVNDAGVHKYPGIFVDQNGASVPFLALSLMEPIPNTDTHSAGELLKDVCVRYEIKNESPSTPIEHFSWDDIGLPYYNFAINGGGQSPGWPRVAHRVRPSPALYPTRVAAFSNHYLTEIQAQFPVKPTPHFFRESSYATDFPELLVAMEQGSLATDQAVLAADLNSIEELPVLIMEFSLPDGVQIWAESLVFSNGESIVFSYKMATSGQVNIAAPMTDALQELRPAPSLESAVKLAQSVVEFEVAKPASDSSGFSLEFGRDAFELGDEGIFLVQQPVTVRSDEGEACIMQSLYSPVPVSADKRKCDLDPEIIQNWQ
jgi:hypothetical protein